MPLGFSQLCEIHGSPDLIPDEVLYEYLDSNRQNLVNEAKLGSDRIPNSKLGKEVRRRTKSDLFWFARYFGWETNPVALGRPVSFNAIDEENYRVVCDLFVKKDDSKSIIEQDDFKSRLLLWPRGGLKSTIDGYDVAQWILNWPHIRVLFHTGDDDLAVGFVGEVKAHFAISETPTLMNLFFPTFCVDPSRKEAADEFDCPAYERKGRKEPTLTASSVGATKAGRHYEVIKNDDGVTDKNSTSSDQCSIISGKLYLAEKLLTPGGYYVDYIGTRYAEEDHYGVMLEKNVESISLVPERTGRCWSYYENRESGLKILIGRAIQIKEEVALSLAKTEKPVTYKEAGESGCDLLLPKFMPFNWLMRELGKNEKSFEGQLNQNPRPASLIAFSRTMMLKATVPYRELPISGPVSQVWDFAFSKKKGRDYSTGCSIIWREEDEVDSNGNKTGNKGIAGYVQEVVRKRFPNPASLAAAVVDLAVKHKPFIVGIEDAAGSHFLTDSIALLATRTGLPEIEAVCSHIDWFAVDNQNDAKRIRMASLHPWITDGRLKFAAHCMVEAGGMDILYSEFEKCLTSCHHDDIPDVVSHQPRYAPRATQQIMENPQAETQTSKEQAIFNLLFEEGTDAFGRIGMGVPALIDYDAEELQDEEMHTETPAGLSNILGTGLYG